MKIDFNEYSTHLAKVWLQNTERDYKYFIALAADALKQAGNDKDKAAEILADQIKNEVKEAAPKSSGLYNDLLTAALDCIDFDEVARDFLDE